MWFNIVAYLWKDPYILANNIIIISTQFSFDNTKYSNLLSQNNSKYENFDINVPWTKDEKGDR